MRYIRYNLSGNWITLRALVQNAAIEWPIHISTLTSIAFSCAFPLPLQASDNRLFNAQNEWILIDPSSSSRRSAEDRADAALQLFEDSLGGAYVLPESRVYAFVETGDGDGDAWEIWEGFKVGQSEKIRVHRHGTVTGAGSELNVNRSVALRTDLRGITLRATTVVSECPTPLPRPEPIPFRICPVTRHT